MHPHFISQMPAFADQYPDMKLIIAHVASKEHVDAIANAKHGNIYTDTSGGASARNNIIEYAVSRVGSEKILFGTDTYSFAFQFGRIALSDIPLKDKENILWKNAIRLFPKCFSLKNQKKVGVTDELERQF
jgi:predicted TIM-barrel fold metal-dependent hydrolase